jgi:predicted enzyme related to lactoylglutathione lyase
MRKPTPSKRPPIGSLVWHDLTVKDAKKVRDFYSKIVGWSFKALDTDGYSMIAPNSEEVAFIAKRKKESVRILSRWIPYILVEDLSTALKKAKRLGGVARSNVMGVRDGIACIVEDPAGAVFGLYQAGNS